jgi:hypothetical protein
VSRRGDLNKRYLSIIALAAAVAALIGVVLESWTIFFWTWGILLVNMLAWRKRR